jgi:hypothetical protein
LYTGSLDFIPNYSYNTDSLFFIASQKGLVISSNHGLNWVMPTNLGLPTFPDGSKNISAMYLNNGNIYAGCIHGFAYSTDIGNHWVSTDMGFSDFCGFTDFKTANGVVFGSVSNTVSANTGVYKTTNNGVNWTIMNNGLPTNASVASLLVSGDYLIAGTNYDGIFRIPLSSITSSDNQGSGIIKDYSLEQNYPNPFNPSTKISFSIQTSGFVSLKVYDVLGKERYTLINGVKSAGNHIVDFNASILSSGIYFYKLESGNFSKTMKMLLIK